MQTDSTQKQKIPLSAQGSIFVYILIAVALFGMLAFVFTRSMKHSTGQLTERQAQMAATEILSYGKLVAGTYDKLRLKGCSEKQISFHHDTDGDGDVDDDDFFKNTQAPIDKSCHMFDPDGGNLAPQEPQESWLGNFENPSIHDSYLPFSSKYYYSCVAKIEEVGEAMKADCMTVVFALKKEICVSINKMAGIEQTTDYWIPTGDTHPSFRDDLVYVIKNEYSGHEFGCLYYPAGKSGYMSFVVYTVR